ncbi:tRNA (adenine(58)-N(1))-methyltransferase non-catalytic subunit trm6 [Cladophialophora chaetospira]|uniref:tRNA (adenine(58)-N(1))-methyltransferase non-catalytic subunit TRM6 n=1 Tax=Cladophialophora chaetospira TaxID=386627 RepID=A0AA38XNZ8_9EURO|nr:tRNA (adenine(58)-N(1))-methyltransferase non-catalytic subunit trm6 [Cladophialophora chaetospira]
MAFSAIQPYQYVAIRLPSDQIQVEQIVPNTLISLGKYGAFRTNQILGRPYHLTFEILDRAEVKDGRELRILPAAELHAAELLEQAETDELSTPVTEREEAATTFKSNVNTHDDPTNQKLTMAEIESLKQNNTGSRELIDKIMSSHSTLDQKTTFSLAKYTLRKHKKYMKRFTVLPLDVTTLVDWMFADREFGKIMEMRNEAVGLAGCWANVHAAGEDDAFLADIGPSSRYLVVDDTGGLLVAAVAERMGILHRTNFDAEAPIFTEEDAEEAEVQPTSTRTPNPKQSRHLAMNAVSNTITLVHANQQPNLGLLRYFNFDSNNPQSDHPLHAHLKSLSWLQLLQPEVDITYQEPTIIADSDLSKMKSNKRSAYCRKRKRWERVKSVVDETRAGGFSGLIVASFTEPTSILRHLVPLLAGGSQVVVYSPNVEPLVELADYYSTARRTAFINTPADERIVPRKDFPVDPTLLLAPMVQTARVRKWQVLPGRTHPMMTSRGGAEGYIFVGTRVIPAEGKVEARGRPPRGKKVKMDEPGAQRTYERAASDDEREAGLKSPTKRFKTENGEEHQSEEAAEDEFVADMRDESAPSRINQADADCLFQQPARHETGGHVDVDMSIEN